MPNRSLGPQGFRILMAAVALVCGVNAVRFAWLGAWPVVAFLLLDILLVWGAFKLSYRAGRAFEEVRLDDQALTVRQVSHHGRERLHAFNPHWVRVDLDRPNELDCHLRLRSHGQALEIGHFLAPFEREDVRVEIERGLARCRTGG